MLRKASSSFDSIVAELDEGEGQAWRDLEAQYGADDVEDAWRSVAPLPEAAEFDVREREGLGGGFFFNFRNGLVTLFLLKSLCASRPTYSYSRGGEMFIFFLGEKNCRNSPIRGETLR